MNRNEHKRVKHGHVPGDISKKNKIAMREKDTPIVILYGKGVDGKRYETVIEEKAAKSYRKFIRDKSKHFQKERDRKAVRDGIDTYGNLSS